MFGWFRKRSRPNLATPKFDFEEFATGNKKVITRRSLRVFVSHRWEKDDYLRDVFASERFPGLLVEDLSLTKDLRIIGPRGGEVDELKIKKEIAARIYASDVLIAPSIKSSLKPRRVKADGEWVHIETDWIGWEIELAALCFNMPVVFVDHRPELRRRINLYERLRKQGAKVATAKADPDDMMSVIFSVFKEDILLFSDSSSELTELMSNRVPPDFAKILERHPFAG
jgi:hypothetical protein